jgi:ketosteroid isomerase-like protein
MKRCPTCQHTYADDTLRFCLEDGTALVGDSVSSSDQTLLMTSAAVSDEPPPTEILDFGVAPTVRAYNEDATARRSKPAQTARQQARPTINEFQNQVAPVPRNTTSVVAVTVIATILLLAVGGLGAWFLLRDKSGNGSSGANTTTDTKRVSNSSNIATTNVNASGSTSSNTGTLPGTVSTPLPSSTPLIVPSATPQPTTQTTTDTSSARREVMNALNGWTETMRQGDVDGHMAYYAETLHTYYMQSNYSASRVRANVAKAFSKYDTFDVKLSNIQIEVDPSGMSAIATFDKTFVFSGATTYSGSGLNRFWLEKIGGRWLITGEKDLKTYYVNND